MLQRIEKRYAYMISIRDEDYNRRLLYYYRSKCLVSERKHRVMGDSVAFFNRSLSILSVYFMGICVYFISKITFSFIHAGLVELARKFNSVRHKLLGAKRVIQTWAQKSNTHLEHAHFQKEFSEFKESSKHCPHWLLYWQNIYLLTPKGTT